MNVSPSKENILKRIRQALSHPVPVPFPGSEGNSSVFQQPAEDLAVQFAEEFTRLNGKFLFCSDLREAAVQLQQLLRVRQWSKVVCKESVFIDAFRDCVSAGTFYEQLQDCDVSITGCEVLVSRTGSVVLSSAPAGGRTTSVYAPVHICVAHTSQLVYDIKDALLLLKERYGDQLPSQISFATGPSRTADIEKTLVVGVHGPKEVFVILVEEPFS